MSDFFKYTLPAHNAQTSKITGEVLKDMNYSKLGALPISQKNVQRISRVASAAGRISQEGLKYIEDDWEEICLDFTQLGLTVVGLIEVAEPLQIAADVANGALDIKRGHPIIGAISIASATPIAGLLAGIPLALIRAFRVVINGLKFLGKSFIAFAVKPAIAVGKFIYLRRGVLLNYSKNVKKFVENSTTKAIEGLPKITEAMLKKIKDFGDKLAKEPIVPVNASKTTQAAKSSSPLVDSLKTPFAHPAIEARKEIQKYRMFPNSYGNIMRPQL